MTFVILAAIWVIVGAFVAWIFGNMAACGEDIDAKD